MDNKQMGTFIAARRKSLGQTQLDLATELGVTDKAVSKWERGLSFPDITLIPHLAKTLQVSVSELMEGQEIPEEQIDMKTSDDIALNSLSYSLVYVRKLNDKTKRNIYWVILGALALADIVCLICNVAISRTVDWALFPLGASIVVAAKMLPLLLFKRHRIVWSLAFLNITVIPYLFLIEVLVPAKGWVVSLALPMLAILDVVVLAEFGIFVAAKKKLLQSMGWMFMVLAAMDAITNLYVDFWLARNGYTPEPRYWWITSVSMLALGAGLLIVGLVRDRKKQASN